MSLKQQTTSGIFWTFSQQFGEQIVYFVVQIILARLLAPSVFGLVAMLQVFLSVGQILLDNGMTSSLIRTDNVDQKDYSTVFIINIIGSIVVYIIIFFCAPLIADFYRIPLIKPIIRVYSLSFIIQALVGVQTARLTKALNFKLQMLMQMPSVVIGGIVGVTLAYLHYGVWSLVYMTLVRAFIFMLQHWFYTDWRPTFLIDKERLKYHFSFGYKLTLSGLLDVIYTNSYNLIIGKLFSSTDLGFYNQADTLRMFPVTNISTALNKVTYPMFAVIKDDDIQLKSVYKKLMMQVLFWVIPVMLTLIVIAKPLLNLVIGPNWMPAVPYFQILSISAIIYPLHLYNLNIVNVKGRSDLFLRLEIIKKVVGSTVIVLSLFWGIMGLIVSQVMFSFCAVYINSYYSGKMIKYPLREQIKDIFPMFLVGLLSISVSWYLYILLNKYSFSDIVVVCLVTAFFFLVYLSISFFAKLPALRDFINLLPDRRYLS